MLLRNGQIIKRPPLTRGLDFAKQKTGGENAYPSVALHARQLP